MRKSLGLFVRKWAWGFVFGLAMCASVAFAQEDKEATKDIDAAADVETVERPNWGREARIMPPAIGRDATQPLSEREKAYHVLNRFAYGPTPGMVDEVVKMGVEKWFETQLANNIEESRVLQTLLSQYDTLTMTTQQVVQKYNPPIPPELSLKNRLTTEQRRQRAELERMKYMPREQLKDVVLLRAVYGNNQLKETATQFWRNHFNIDVSKATTLLYGNTYDRDVIRAEALGTFRRMFFKQAMHPAMLVYLDNYISRAVPKEELWRAARAAYNRSKDYATALDAVDIAKMKGLNENYARELMELHTLGVDNYYSQDDVITLAEAITGWTFNQDRSKPIEFTFRKDMHASGARRLLRARIPANPRNPEMEGKQALELLVKHKGTSEFIAYKLCRYYVNDRPSMRMVRRVAAEFRRKNQTDLAATYRAIFRDEEFFDPANYMAKFKVPIEFVSSALRVTNAEVVSCDGLQHALLSMNEPIYQCEDPTGYYDQSDRWNDPGVMAARWQFGVGLGMGWIRGVRIPPSYWEGLEANNPLQWKEVLCKRILPTGHTDKTDKALEDVIAKYSKFNPTPEQMGRYIVGILLGSPEFQRQ